MSAEMRVVEGEEAVGGMIARLEGMKEEVAEEDGETIALLQDVAPLQDEARHREVVLLQDVEVLLHRDRVCSWHRGLSEVQAEVVEVAGGNVKSRRRNLGALEVETTVLQDVTLLQGGVARPQDEVLPQEEAHLQEEVHLQGEEALLAGMKGEVMQEVGDVAVVVEALLQGEDLHQEGVLLQGVAHLQGEAPLQGVEEVLMMEVDLGGLGLAEVMTGALREGDHRQGEVPLLGGALRHDVGLLLGEVHPPGEATRHAGDLHLAEMRAAVTEVPGGAVEEEEEVDLHLGEVLRPGEDPHQGEALHLAVMVHLAMMVLQTGGVTVQQAMTELHRDPTTAHHPDPKTELLPSPLASLTKAGPRWPSVKPTWSSHLGRFDLKASPALPWPPPLLWVAL